jgi:ribosomal protein S18 acetylase RimI-like enzyme
MIIRKATINDAEALAQCILLAMEDIVFRFIDTTDHHVARKFMMHFTSTTGNQYSYENCRVAEEDNKVIAAVCVYDGARLHALRAPVLHYIKECFGKDLQVEDETQPGEYYIDSLGVLPHRQGQGVATKMLQSLIEEYVSGQQQTLGLLVEEDNPGAKRLYCKLGFQVTIKKIFAGKKVEHLQMRP